MVNAIFLAAEATTHGGGLFNLFGLDVTSSVVTEWAIMVVIMIVAVAAGSRVRRIPGRFQAAFEIMTNGIVDGIVAPAIGGREKALRYLPLLGSLFLFILISNLSGLLPGGVMHLPGFKPPTSELSVTAGLAVVAIIAANYAGVQEKGWHHFGHFLKPFPFMLPLNILEEVVKPLSLALRLFGNIYGGETVLATLLTFFPWFIPVPIMGLELFFGFLQAFIFTMLTSLYIGTATAHAH